MHRPWRSPLATPWRSALPKAVAEWLVLEGEDRARALLADGSLGAEIAQVIRGLEESVGEKHLELFEAREVLLRALGQDPERDAGKTVAQLASALDLDCDAEHDRAEQAEAKLGGMLGELREGAARHRPHRRTEEKP